MIKYADMHTKGVSLIHLYDEGNDLDFNIGLYFYEKLYNKVMESAEGKRWREDPSFAPSMPSFMTAIVRKQELREKVDVNFDGRISFLEYLLCKWPFFLSSATFAQQSGIPALTKCYRSIPRVLQPCRLLRACHENIWRG